jgi:Peptidase family M13
LEIAGALIYPAAMLRKYLVALSIALAVAGAARAEPRSGIDISAIDPAVPSQQDFWRFANGKWLAATPIPADRSAWNTFAALYETTQQQLRDVIEGIDPRSPDGSEPRKLADFYGSFMDEARVEAAGLEALRDELARIHGLNDKAALPALFAHLARLWVRTPWQLEIEPGSARCHALCRASGAKPAGIAGSRLLSQGRCAFPDHPEGLSRAHRQIAFARRRAGGGGWRRRHHRAGDRDRASVVDAS